MQTLSVLLPKENPVYGEQFRRMIHTVSRQIETSPVTVEWRESSGDQHEIISFTGWHESDHGEETIHTLRSYVALIIVEWIVQVVEREHIQRLLCRDYAILPAEQKKIYPYVQQVLHSEIDEQQTRKAQLFYDMYHYLEDSPLVQLQGYVRFRLKKYWDDVARAVEIGLEDYRQDMEYREFVELLRFFVSVQETKITAIHLIPGKDNQLFLCDEHKQQINLERVETALGLPLQGIEDDEYLVSALILLAPDKIVFHQASKRQPLAVTLQHIFADRLYLCTVCAECAQYQRHILDLAKATLYNT